MTWFFPFEFSPNKYVTKYNLNKVVCSMGLLQTSARAKIRVSPSKKCLKNHDDAWAKSEMHS